MTYRQKLLIRAALSDVGHGVLVIGLGLVLVMRGKGTLMEAMGREVVTGEVVPDAEAVTEPTDEVTASE